MACSKKRLKLSIPIFEGADRAFSFMGTCRVIQYGRTLHLIEDFEITVDEAVHKFLFPLICANEGNRMPDYLTTILMKTHPYVLYKDDIIISEQYQPLKDV